MKVYFWLGYELNDLKVFFVDRTHHFTILYQLIVYPVYTWMCIFCSKQHLMYWMALLYNLTDVKLISYFLSTYRVTLFSFEVLFCSFLVLTWWAYVSSGILFFWHVMALLQLEFSICPGICCMYFKLLSCAKDWSSLHNLRRKATYVMTGTLDKYISWMMLKDNDSEVGYLLSRPHPFPEEPRDLL